jgi:hypothetical protein
VADKIHPFCIMEVAVISAAGIIFAMHGNCSKD